MIYVKTIIVSILIFGFINTISLTKTCSRPHVKRSQVFVYRTVGNINVKVYRCIYDDPRTGYSDISDQCIIAFQTGKLINKWDQVLSIKNPSSRITLDEYITQADLLKNQILLRSGTKCRYDRGFCYDPRESLSHAVVWKVIPVPTEKCPNNLEQVFYGHVDIWTFPKEKQKYLFYYDFNYDRSFFLKLSSVTGCHLKQVWYTDEDKYIVSQLSLSKTYHPTTKLSIDYFPMYPKSQVTEAILKDCDLSAYGQSFSNIHSEYLKNPEHLKVLLNTYQNNVSKTTKALEIYNSTFKKIGLFEEDKNKVMNNIKLILGTHQTRIAKIEEQLTDASKNINLGNRIGDSDQNNCDKTCNDGITNITADVNNLTNTVKNITSLITKQKELSNKLLTSKENIEKNIASLQTDIHNIEQSNNGISNQLEQCNNYTTRFEYLEQSLKKNYDTLKQEIMGQIYNLKTDIKTSKDTVTNDVLDRIVTLNITIANIKKILDNFTFSHNAEIYSVKQKLEILTTNTTSNYDTLINNFSEIGKSLDLKYSNLNNLINTKSSDVDKSIDILKTDITKQAESIINDINKINNKYIDLKNTFNNTIKNNINLYSTQVNQLETRFLDMLNNNKQTNDITNKSIMEKIDTLNQILKKSPETIEQNIFRKFTTILDEKSKQINSYSTKFEEVENNTNKIIQNITESLVSLIKIEEVKLNNLNESLNNRSIANNIQFQDVSNKIETITNIISEKGQEIYTAISSIKQNQSSLEDTVNKLFLNNNQCKDDIKSLNNNMMKSISELKENISNDFIDVVEELQKTIENETNSCKSVLQKVETRLTTCNENVNANQNEINNIKNNISNLNSTFNTIPVEFESKISKIIEDKLKLQNDTCNSALQTLQIKIFENEKLIESMKTEQKNILEEKDKEIEKIRQAFEDKLNEFKKEFEEFKISLLTPEPQ